MAGRDYRVGVRITAEDLATARANATFASIVRGATSAQSRMAGIGSIAVAAGSKVMSVASRAIGYGIAGLGVGSLAGANHLIRGYAGVGDELIRQSTRMNASVEAIQEWRHVAKMAADKEAPEFDAALGVLNRSVGMLRAGSGPLSGYLKRMGKDGADLAQRLAGSGSTDEALQLVIGRMRELPNVADRAALAQVAFGRGGAWLTDLAAKSADEIKGLHAEARAFGSFLSKDAADAASVFDDDLKRMDMNVKGIGVGITRELMPALMPMVREFNGWLRANHKEVIRDIASGIKGMAEGARELAPLIPPILKGVGFLATNAKAFAAIWLGSKLVKGINAVTAAVEALAVAEAAAAGGAGAARAGVAGVAGATGVGAGLTGVAVTGLLAGVGATAFAQYKDQDYRLRRDRNNAKFRGLEAGGEVQTWRAGATGEIQRAAEAEIMSLASRTLSSPDVLSHPKTEAEVQAVGKFWEEAAAIYRKKAAEAGFTLTDAENVAGGRAARQQFEAGQAKDASLHDKVDVNIHLAGAPPGTRTSMTSTGRVRPTLETGRRAAY